MRTDVTVIPNIECQLNNGNLVVAEGDVIILPDPFNRRRGVGCVDGRLVLVKCERHGSSFLLRNRGK